MTKSLPIISCALLLSAAPSSAQNDPTTTVGDTGTVTLTYMGATKTYTTVRAADGKIWLQQNLGSSGVATAYNDTTGYGHLFQWGRWDDGHQHRDSTAAQASTLPANNPFGVFPGSAFFYRGANPADWWGAGSGTDTWAGTTANTTNGKDPCTAIGPNWHLADQAEWNSVLTLENITDRASAFSSNLKLTAAGMREGSLGNLVNVGVYGQYWISAASGPYAKDVTILDNAINPSDDAYRSYGFSVRCMTATCTGLFMPGAIQGSDSVCEGASITYTVPATPNASTIGYAWTVPTGWAITSAINSNTIVVKAGSASGNITVTASNDCDTSPVRSFAVYVRHNPVPVISAAGNVLSTTTTFASYQWLLNNGAIAGATNASYTATANGSYRVIVSDANGCSDTSAALNVTSVAVGAMQGPASIRIYPNPAEDVVYIASPVKVHAAVYSMDGRLVLQQADARELRISQLQPGVYTIRLTGEDGRLMHTGRLTRTR